jgi:glutamate-1-semialdehyde 2,1-aminomutase
LFSVSFTDGPVRDLGGAEAADLERYARFFHHQLGRGVALPPSGFELWTLSTAHRGPEVAQVLEAAASFPG